MLKKKINLKFEKWRYIWEWHDALTDFQKRISRNEIPIITSRELAEAIYVSLSQFSQERLHHFAMDYAKRMMRGINAYRRKGRK